MISRLKYFYDSLNIVLISTTGPEFFYAKCSQFHLTFIYIYIYIYIFITTF